MGNLRFAVRMIQESEKNPQAQRWITRFRGKWEKIDLNRFWILFVIS